MQRRNSGRGFASMSPEQRSSIARKGGQHSHGGRGGYEEDYDQDDYDQNEYNNDEDDYDDDLDGEDDNDELLRKSLDTEFPLSGGETDEDE